MSVDAPGTPPAEVEISEDLIATLIASQFPEFSNMPMRIVGEGWDNVMARIGGELAARVPRHAVGEKLLKREQKWLPQLAPNLPLPVPASVHIGRPSEDYPFTWSIVPWFPGETAATCAPSSDEAKTLASFLKAVHQPAPKSAPINPHRGHALAGKRKETQRRMDILHKQSDLITADLLKLWRMALAEQIDVSPTWIAGDIHPQNVLVNDGKFTAFIDWGDMCAGDPATDLASIWMLLGEPAAREAAIEAYGMSQSTRLRAMGWAIFFGVILFETGLQDDPLHAQSGEATLRRLNADL